MKWRMESIIAFGEIYTFHWRKIQSEAEMDIF